MVGILRRISSVLEGLEQQLATPPDMGAEIGSIDSSFELVDADGQTVGFNEFVQEPTIMLMSANYCPACRKLLRELDGVSGSIGGGPPPGVTNEDDPETHHPPRGRLLYQPPPALVATTALRHRPNPHAYLLDP